MNLASLSTLTRPLNLASLSTVNPLFNFVNPETFNSLLTSNFSSNFESLETLKFPPIVKSPLLLPLLIRSPFNSIFPWTFKVLLTTTSSAFTAILLILENCLLVSKLELRTIDLIINNIIN